MSDCQRLAARMVGDGRIAQQMCPEPHPRALDLLPPCPSLSVLGVGS